MRSKVIFFYDFENDNFRIREKLTNNLLAKAEKIDFDVINFESNTTAPLDNAFLNLNTYDLQINGIPRVFISKAQDVNIFPANNSVVIKKDRNFRFDGVVNAGNLTFYGNNFFFEYYGFKITMQNIDSVSIRAETEQTDASGMKLFTEVRNKLINLTGVIYIDQPDNKSGREIFADFPKFSSTQYSNVFFNNPEIQEGVYTADKVYFRVDPFNMDSLKTFQNTDLRFSGKFISGGIFPDIVENLTLQKDFSLGFTYKTPLTGIPVFGGKGVFYEYINLSNNGIIGAGKLIFETTELTGNEFVFYPDSMNLLATNLRVNQSTPGTQFPFVQSKNNIVQWLPETNQLSVKQGDTPFNIHNQTTILNGNLVISPSGVFGSGDLLFSDARLSASSFVFTATETIADTADFALKIPAQGENSFSAKNFKTRMNHFANKGEFRSNEGFNTVYFPVNRYVGFVESFEWLLQENLLKFASSKTPENEEFTGAKYISVHPLQDSFYFISPNLEYNYQSNLMFASEVQHVKVADVFIYPNQGKLIVEAGAKLRPLENSIITTSLTNPLHRIYEARTIIESKYNYTASGFYDYLDESGKSQKIFFERIEVDEMRRTIARGNIIEPDNFTLSPNFEFQGAVSFFADKPFLSFKGGARIVHDCRQIPRTWLAFESEINPENVQIPVINNPLNINRDRVFSGSFIANDSIHIYPSFISFRKRFNDVQINSAGEWLTFDETNDKYLLGSKEKMTNPELPGNQLVFDINQCIIMSSGKVNPDIDLGQLKFEASGSTIYNINANSLELDLMITLDFFFDEKALQTLIQDLDSLPGAKASNFRLPENKNKIREFIGFEKTEALWKDLESTEKFTTVPKELSKTIVLNDVRLKWHQESRSYQSYGRIEISNIKGTPVHKSVNGFIEISKRRAGDFFDLYLEIEPNNWYYFGYTREVMLAYSTNKAFNQALLASSVYQRQMPVGRGQTGYIYDSH